MTPDWVIDNLSSRLIIAIAIALAGIMLYKALNGWVLARARVRGSRSVNLHLPSRPVKATLLYFTTQTCAPCRTIQRPAIRKLSERLGSSLEVIEIDAGLQPELAGEWGVLSVPTTFILDAHGAPKHVNHGVAPMEKLLRQINDL